MEPEQALGAVLRTTRREQQMSQEALALEAGVERNYVSLIELGRNSPSVRMLFKLCTALQISPSVFLSLVEEQMAQAKKKKRSSKVAHTK